MKKNLFAQFDKYYWLTVLALVIKSVLYVATLELHFKFWSISDFKFVIAVVGTGIFMTAPFLLATKKRANYLNRLNIFLSLLLFADTLYGRYYYAPISLETIFSVNLNMMGTTGGSIGDLLKISDVLFFIDIPVFMFFKKKYPSKVLKNKPSKRILLMSIMILLSIVLTFSSMIGTDFSYYSQNNNYITRNLGVLDFHIYDISNEIYKLFDNKEGDEEIHAEISEFLDQKEQNGQQYTGAEAGNNLIVVQMEALQEFVIGLEVDGKEVTPNLNRLLEDSVYFDQIYVQTAGGNTSDAEFIFHTSLYPAKAGAASARYNENTYSALPKLLGNEYLSNVFHANNAEFWSRDKMYEAFGVDKYYSIEEFTIDEKIGYNGSSLSDDSFYRQAIDEMKDMEEPFFNYLISLSSHHPFTFFKDTNEFDVGDLTGTFIGNYLKAQNYSDKALGSFIDSLKEVGLYKNSVIVVFGDHSGVVKSDQENLMALLGKEASEVNWQSEQKVPLIIKGTALEKNTVNSTIGGQIDILPTITNLFDLDSKNMLGRDLFNTDESFVIFRNGSFINNNIYYAQKYEIGFDMTLGDIIEKNEYSDLIDKMHYPLKINDLILESNYN